MIYKLIDCQGEYPDRYFASKKDIVDLLASYHDNDYDGEKSDGTCYENIYEFLDTLGDTEEKLAWLMDYGYWDIEEVKEELDEEICVECGNSVKQGSGKFVNRVRVLDNFEERVKAGMHYPEGGYICADCMEMTSTGGINE